MNDWNPSSPKPTIVEDINTTEEIKEMLLEKRPLPMGVKAFNEFFERVWSGALIPHEPGMEYKLKRSCKALLADEMIHLPGSQTHECDLYFINRFRKLACNQICLFIKDAIKAELMKEHEEAKKAAEASAAEASNVVPIA